MRGEKMKISPFCCLSSWFVIISLVSFHLIVYVDCLPDIIRIGGLFAEGEEEQEAAFRFAVDRINDDHHILPRTILVAQVERVYTADSYDAEKKVCGLLRNGVAGIVGPLSEISSMHVRSICDALEIPHIEVGWEFQHRRDGTTINLYPRVEKLALALLSVVKGLDWDEFAIAYEENEAIVTYQDILKEGQVKNRKMMLFQFTLDRPYRDIFWEIKEKKTTKNIILDVQKENVLEILKHAQQVGLMTDEYHYILMSLDMTLLDLEDFIHSGANITCFRLVEDNNLELVTLLNDWEYLSKRTGRVTIPAPERLSTEAALVYDAVKLLANALEGLDSSKVIIDVNPVSCEDEVPWPHGTSLVNYMRPIVFRGVSGLVSFDEMGHRTDFTMDLMSMSRGKGLQKIGFWTTPRKNMTGLNISEAWRSEFSVYDNEKTKLIVSTLINEPYTYKTDSFKTLIGNAQYEGYAIDLIDELSKLLDFEYEIRLVADGGYGSPVKDANGKPIPGKWNGLVGEVMRGEADMGIVDLTITKSRETAVDFTLPFMTTGVSILFLKPTGGDSALMAFLQPFHIVVWAYLCLTTAAISIVFCIVGRLSPYEWDNPFPCKADEPILMNECSVENSFWFTVGSLMQQGSDLAPKSMSTRTVGGVWYFFTLIMVASYTANLAAFLTIEVIPYPFKDYKGLAEQNEIGYGATIGGSTRTSFKESVDPDMKKLSNFMEANVDTMLPANNGEGLKKVTQGKYAFFMEAAAIEYHVERKCNLTQIGGMLDSKGYGIATKKDSPLRQRLSRGILKLQEQGKLQILYERWWKQKKGGGACSSKPPAGVTALSLKNVGGVFVVLVGGLAFSLFMAMGEFVYKLWRSTPDWKTMWDEMVHDFKFMVKLGEYTKTVRKRKSPSTSSSSRNVSGSKEKDAETEAKQTESQPKLATDIAD